MTVVLILIGVQKCQFLAKSANLTNSDAYFSCKLIPYNECLKRVHSFDFSPNIHTTKIVQFLIS